MKARSIFTIVVILCLNLVLTGAAIAHGTSPATELSRPQQGWGALGSDEPPVRTVFLPLVMRDYPAFAITSISAGGSRADFSHTCALSNRGGVKCWGSNDYGQLGDGTRINHETPVDVSGLGSAVTAIASGGGSTCALTDAGGVKCWGSGHGTSINNSLTPKDIVGLTSNVRAIANGPNHACALTNAGGVKCWGGNPYGQLGDGTTTTRPTPVDVIGLTSGVKAIAVGYWHTCALTDGGAVKCWGGDTSNGTIADSSTPVDVSTLGSGVAAISAGGSHTCAILVNGSVKCWGGNSRGQLGNGTATTTPPYGSPTPVDVIGLAGSVRAISARYFHTCAITNAGQVQCWGDNSSGQIGDNTTEQRTTPTNVSGLDNSTTVVTAGHLHTCALSTGSHVMCWGANGSGQLGDGTTTNRLVPVDVVGLVPTP